MTERLPITWAIARGRDALESIQRYNEVDVEEDEQAVEVINKWLQREFNRRNKRKEP